MFIFPIINTQKEKSQLSTRTKVRFWKWLFFPLWPVQCSAWGRNGDLVGPSTSLPQESGELWVSNAPKFGHLTSKLSAGRHVVNQFHCSVNGLQQKFLRFNANSRIKVWKSKWYLTDEHLCNSTNGCNTYRPQSQMQSWQNLRCCSRSRRLASCWSWCSSGFGSIVGCYGCYRILDGIGIPRQGLKRQPRLRQ